MLKYVCGDKGDSKISLIVDKAAAASFDSLTSSSLFSSASLLCNELNKLKR